MSVPEDFRRPSGSLSTPAGVPTVAPPSACSEAEIQAEALEAAATAMVGVGGSEDTPEIRYLREHAAELRAEAGASKHEGART